MNLTSMCQVGQPPQLNLPDDLASAEAMDAWWGLIKTMITFRVLCLMLYTSIYIGQHVHIRGSWDLVSSL